MTCGTSLIELHPIRIHNSIHAQVSADAGIDPTRNKKPASPSTQGSPANQLFMYDKSNKQNFSTSCKLLFTISICRCEKRVKNYVIKTTKIIIISNKEKKYQDINFQYKWPATPCPDVPSIATDRQQLSILIIRRAEHQLCHVFRPQVAGSIG